MADGNKPYEQPNDPFKDVKFPEKFLKEGKPDLVTFVNSYGELEARQGKKEEELRTVIKGELEGEYKKGRVDAPDKYTVPKIDGIDEKELAENPLLKSFREDAHKAGMTDDQFGIAVRRYVETLVEEPVDMEALKRELGDNTNARVSAVETWAKGYAKTPGELAALQKIAVNGEGVKLLERLAGLNGGTGGTDNDTGNREPEITLEALRKMQDDPRYYDPARREAAFVKKVEEGYEKLYPPKR